MKKSVLILFIALPIMAISQEIVSPKSKNPVLDTSKDIMTEILINTEKAIARKAIYYRKSYDIISIKAYRKSLKDKVKRKRLC